MHQAKRFKSDHYIVHDVVDMEHEGKILKLLNFHSENNRLS